ncbi:MAG: DNA recombination protein RmuC [Candidatus Moraniibacteriota bacterium]|nr:MAG: DNA recombination protein RmuC [Candidatus Moranbacteria bacterium]
MEKYLLFGNVFIGVAILFFLFKKSSEKNEKENFFLDRMDRMEKSILLLLRQESYQGRQEMSRGNQDSREELRDILKGISQSQGEGLERFRKQLAELIEKNENRMEDIRKVVEERLLILQKDNAEKLEKMRQTVDEKLHNTLEKRLDASFVKVQVQLESVYKGLGEMRTLALGVGDLKKVLQNVKTRGTWGEAQLGNLLADILTIEQYDINVATKLGSNDRVEFAIKIPAKREDGKYVLLPIDAKFPLEDYQLLVDASEKGDLEKIDYYAKQLEIRIKSEAKDIRDKYLDPPTTTDFGILFLPNEGLYAEVLRRGGLADVLRREYRIVVAGPATIAAFLNSLQMGFRTLAIEKQSSQVWELLATVKKEFSVFGDILDKTHKKLQEASNAIERASSKSRTIEKRLKKAQELPSECLEETNKEFLQEERNSSIINERS